MLNTTLQALLVDTNEEEIRRSLGMSIPRVDYLYYNWALHNFGPNWSMLRRIYPQEVNEWDPDPSFKLRCQNVLWRRWSAHLYGLDKFPPEKINWNKDADLSFLYGPVCHIDIDGQPHFRRSVSGSRLKPVLKRPSLSDTLRSASNVSLVPSETSPVSAPPSIFPTPPRSSEPPELDLSMALPTGKSDTQVSPPLSPRSPNGTDRPRLRFNSRVEQCMVVFSDEEELLPTEDESDYGDYADDEDTTAGRGKSLLRGSSMVPNLSARTNTISTGIANGTSSAAQADDLLRREGPADKTSSYPNINSGGNPAQSVFPSGNAPKRHSPPGIVAELGQALQKAPNGPSPIKKRRNRHTIIIKLEPTTLNDDVKRADGSHSTPKTQSYEADSMDDLELDEFDDLVPLFRANDEYEDNQAQTAYSHTASLSLKHQHENQNNRTKGHVDSDSSHDDKHAPNYIQTIHDKLRRWVGSSTEPPDASIGQQIEHDVSSSKGFVIEEDDDDYDYYNDSLLSSPSGTCSWPDTQKSEQQVPEIVRDNIGARSSTFSEDLAVGTYLSGGDGGYLRYKGGLDEDDILAREWEMGRHSHGSDLMSDESVDISTPEKIKAMMYYYQLHQNRQQGQTKDGTPPQNMVGNVNNFSAGNYNPDSFLDVAEDRLVNTVDAIKWCASFMSNYTFF